MRSVVAVVIAVSASAAAQPAPPPESPFEEGRKLLDAGKPDEACAKFEEALVAEPEAYGTMLNLGLCNEQRDRLATALRWFRKAQTRASATGTTDYERAAKEKTTALTAKVPAVRLVLTHAAPADAYILVDGVRIEPVDYPLVELDAGRHVVELHGVAIPAQTIELADGQRPTVRVLVPVPEQERVVTKEKPVDAGRPRRRLAIALAATGGALLAGDVALGLVAKPKFDAFDHPGDRGRWQDIMRYGGTSIFVVGAGAIATAVYLLVKKPRAHRVERAVVVPELGPDRAGVVVRGGW